MTQLDLLAGDEQSGVVVSLEAYRRRRTEAAAGAASRVSRFPDMAGRLPDARQTAHRARMLRHLAAAAPRER